MVIISVHANYCRFIVIFSTSDNIFTTKENFQYKNKIITYQKKKKGKYILTLTKYKVPIAVAQPKNNFREGVT